MGGGNGQKSKTAKERNQKKKADVAKKKKMQSKDYKQDEQAKKEAFKCTKCMQPFPNTSSQTTLSQHVASKHSGKNAFSFEECFPTWGGGGGAAVSTNDSDKNKKDEFKKSNKKK
mmetsp:Transcript_22424/g.35982  ORF Transcript_22424/g.35982 Transcript_22424/m.35982 type:complete len:115 (-) Transcript_22424:116-460(-)|eukprot:CAMPEP_0202694952 /NCGR_PEP_ID=MMETSP1385-20130828/8673_1 /ASSEMBLY_ACC=CAM_ASM_000861 /TAXON_ID=933848 /ORGANISM="Elphidium margaritaceum" /LENGTH=114 /DNA_ID=CAMNT_0049350895 /DNA_START=46 /DNA_END=390 /DNA_ORIENTATION=+